jgi:carbonic anhydrase
MKTKTLLITMLLGVALVGATAHASGKAVTMTKEAQQALTPQAALQLLKDGNARFAADKPLKRNLQKQVKETAKGQYPFASIVSCLDSRTSSEIIFDQGIGDVFNARIAGNIVNTDILGSLEFASKAAGAKVILVVGHTACGAIKGACDNVELGNLTTLIDKMEPAVAKTTSAPGEDRSSKNNAFVDRVAETNVRETMAAIRKDSPVLAQMEKDGQLIIAGGMYDLATGKVTFLK